MPEISMCPKCQRQVSIPRGLKSAALVRCPLCDAEYPLSQALPPELIPVLAATEENGAEDDLVMAPLESGEHLFEEGDTYGLAEAHVAEHDSEKEEVAEEEENQAAAVVARMPVGVARRRKRPPKPWWQTPIELVSGGAAGLLFGYYVLAFCLGTELQSRGFPVLTFLPGITRLTTPAGKANNGAVKAAVKKPAAPKPPPDAKPAPKTPDEPKEPMKEPANASPEAAAPADKTPEVATPKPEPANAPPADKTPEVATAKPEPAKAPPPDKAPEVATPKPEPKPLRPTPGTADYFGPRMPMSISSDQLDKAVKEADDLLFADKTDQPMSPKTFEAFCRLGEAVAFVNGDASDAELPQRIEAAGKLLEKVAGLAQVCKKLGQAGGERVDAKSGQNIGVLLAGTVKNVVKQGRLWGAVVQLTDQSKSVNVLSDRELATKVGDRALVLGVVVRDPGSNLVGYSGTKPAVVWAAALAKAP